MASQFHKEYINKIIALVAELLDPEATDIPPLLKSLFTEMLEDFKHKTDFIKKREDQLKILAKANSQVQ